MDVFITLFVGIAVGVLLMGVYYSMRDYWRKSKELRSASAKARKEMQEKSMKARLDAQKARTAVLDAGLRVFVLVLIIVVGIWVIWTIALL